MEIADGKTEVEAFRSQGAEEAPTKHSIHIEVAITANFGSSFTVLTYEQIEQAIVLWCLNVLWCRLFERN